MLDRYRNGIAATWLFILFGAPSPAQHPNHQLGPTAALAAGEGLDLYSKRALRRARTLLQLKLLDIRKERLACVYEVLKNRLPPELLWDDNARALYPGAKPACLHDLK